MPTLREALTLALTHFNAGRLDPAESIYRQVLAAQPGELNSLNMLGLIALKRNQPQAAVEHLRHVAEKAPTFIEGRSNYGAALQAANRLDDAAACFEKLIADAPQFAQAHFNLARVYKDQNKLEKARGAYLRAIALHPNLADAHNNLSAIYRKLNDPEKALASISAAVALQPNSADYHYALGCVHRELCNMNASAECFRQAIALDPNNADAHRDLGFILLTQGHLEGGYREHEWRFQCRDAVNPYPHPIQPAWDGSPLNGRSLFLVTEQGLGDNIQMIRYAPLIAALGGKIHVICSEPLQRLFSRVPSIEECYTAKDAIPICDAYAMSMSLPFLFKTTLDSIPHITPYLSADPADIARWREKISPTPSKAGQLKVGLAWSGNPKYMNDHHRSIAAEKFAPLSAAANATFFSLQKSPQSLPPLPLIDFTADLHDLADTAALIENLDLIITVDTAIAHLAAALNKPTWIFIPHVPDARWLLDRTDSPWYPTVRLFRQPQRNDWQAPIVDVAQALQQFTVSPPSSR